MLNWNPFSPAWSDVELWSDLWKEGGPATYTEEDPIDIAGAMAEVQALQTNWYEGGWAQGAPLVTDRNLMAVTQAIRSAILSARNNLTTNALMTQAIHDLPPIGTPLEVYKEHLAPIHKNHPTYKYLPTLDEGIELATRIALIDVFTAGGSGRIWRDEMMARKHTKPKEMGILGLSVKTLSFAWLMLMPLTSQIATIDTHMTSIVKFHFPEDPLVKAVPDDGPKTPKEYYHLEALFKEMRNMKGYGSIPLAAYQWAEWDYYRTGPGYDPKFPRFYQDKGWHQDHTPFKVEDPEDANRIEWGPPNRQRVSPQGFEPPADFTRAMPGPGETRTPPAFSSWGDSWDPWED